jgi:hypothetical protein
MIFGCQNESAYWTHTDSPGLLQGPQSRGYSATRRLVSSGLNGVKKNGVRQLRHNAPEFLRPEGTAHTGPLMRGYANSPGGGGPQGSVSTVRHGEAGEVSVACEHPILHEAVCLVCGAAMQGEYRKGSSTGAQAGLEDGEGPATWPSSLDVRGFQAPRR